MNQLYRHKGAMYREARLDPEIQKHIEFVVYVRGLMDQAITTLREVEAGEAAVSEQEQRVLLTGLQELKQRLRPTISYLHDILNL